MNVSKVRKFFQFDYLGLNYYDDLSVVFNKQGTVQIISSLSNSWRDHEWIIYFIVLKYKGISLSYLRGKLLPREL